MWLINYECKCIKNMEWVKLWKNCINSKQITALIYLSLMIIYSIEKILKVITFKITMTIDHMSMHCSINMYNSKRM